MWRYPLRCGSVETDPEAYMQKSLLARSCNLEQPCTVKTDGLFYHRVVTLVAWLIWYQRLIVYNNKEVVFFLLFSLFQNEEKRRKLVVSYNKPLVPSKPQSGYPGCMAYFGIRG